LIPTLIVAVLFERGASAAAAEAYFLAIASLNDFLIDKTI